MKARNWFYLLVAAFLVWLVVAVRIHAADPALDTTVSTDPEPAAPATTVQVERTLQGRNVEQWHKIAARYLSRKRSLERAVRRDPETTTAIQVACVIYGHCGELWRKARCESRLWRYARNPSSGASGLFQFLPSTWRSTPFGYLSIFDPYANALAAGWMHSAGRGREWVCR